MIKLSDRSDVNKCIKLTRNLFKKNIIHSDRDERSSPPPSGEPMAFQTVTMT